MVLVDVSAGGVLVDVGRPLRPGARVYFQLVTESRTFAIATQVLRCAVSALDPGTGVTYRGALKFEHLCELKWEHATLTGLSVPGHAKPGADERTQPLPATVTSGSTHARRSGK